MASAEDIESFNRKRQGDTTTDTIIPELPQLPDEVKKRFPAMALYEKQMREWREKLNIALRGVRGGS